ncbi:MAG: hypothetical protein CMA63_04140 [Euryarchaeota archaeon]|nr:hypothetical protein [Euryarchaeota archaeon]|tara:strand:- start:3433 stop:4221 length:789 start_codon:yes stop_codon:yes gene_type:complete
MNQEQWGVFVEEAGKVHVVELLPEVRKVKGLGVLDAHKLLSPINIGEQVLVGQKVLTRLPMRLPEMSKGMLRRAQTISAKDAGFITSRLGIGSGDRILEAGIGSGGLSMYIARSLGTSGIHVTVEPRSEHAEVGLENLRRAKESWVGFPSHHHIEGTIEETVEQITEHSEAYEAIILDLPEHQTAIEAVAHLLSLGGRIACYCPVTSQLEHAWKACESQGLEIEWAGELMEREWGMASKGGVRPVNGPFGHTAFLLVAQRKA